MDEYDLISKTALLRHLDMAMECKNCPRNADKDLYKCVHNPTSELCTCSDIAHICNTITDFETFADAHPVISGDNCIVCGRNVHKDDVYYDVNGGTICEVCMNTKCKCKNGR